MARHLLWWLGALISSAKEFSLVRIPHNGFPRVKWVALLDLTILPLLAHTAGRELLVGA